MKASSISVNGQRVPLHAANTIVVGAGAAGMACAVQLVRFWRTRGVQDAASRVLVVTGGLPRGASRMSGSDKQTYYKMGTSPRVPDTAEDFAKTLTAFGCCHGDTALVEGVGSLRGFYSLVELGVPFPHEPWGAFIGYKTDHDPHERATSAGPKTSRFMSECLQAEALRMGIGIVDKHPVLEFVTLGEGDQRRIVGMVCFDRSRTTDDRPALTAFSADNWVLAGGGPGEIYRDTVYPRGQVGLHGPALLAGLEACNLTESQFGLASTRFRWNVSGTYMQVVPRIFSSGPAGADDDPREFLTEYFGDLSSMATNIFLKGYQWPFDAQRIAGGRSSLVDMAVHQETVVRGRRVWMDFLRNPIGPAAWGEFGIDGLQNEALDYLRKTGAMQPRPIDRLMHMNPPAIDIYAENGIDLWTEPLEIAVCAQHMNGGFSINKWWESSIRHTFVIGEMAGTHGVKRPGGSALNAGQVGATRAAEYIANVYDGDAAGVEDQRRKLLKRRLAANLEHLHATLAAGVKADATIQQGIAEVRERMTRYGAHLRSRDGAAKALAAAVRQYRRLVEEGVRLDSARQLPEAFQLLQQCITHVAILKAVCAMFERGAGSRGSHCILAEDGVEMDGRLIDPETNRPYRFRPENESLRQQIVCVRHNSRAEDLFDAWDIAPRPIPRREIAFEPAWTEFREATVFRV